MSPGAHGVATRYRTIRVQLDDIEISLDPCPFPVNEDDP